MNLTGPQPDAIVPGSYGPVSTGSFTVPVHTWIAILMSGGGGGGSSDDGASKFNDGGVGGATSWQSGGNPGVILQAAYGGNAGGQGTTGLGNVYYGGIANGTTGAAGGFGNFSGFGGNGGTSFETYFTGQIPPGTVLQFTYGNPGSGGTTGTNVGGAGSYGFVGISWG